MTSETILWTYALPPDVKVTPSRGGAYLLTAAGQMWVGADEFEVIKQLTGEGRSQIQLQHRVPSIESDTDVGTLCAALLFRLDRAGLLARTLTSGGRQLASCVPVRAPPGPPPQSAPEAPVRLSSHTLARVRANGISLEMPGSWATITLHDRDLLALLHDLSTARHSTELASAVPGYSEKAMLALLALMNWCDLFDRNEDGWSVHDLHFHTHTRTGYARAIRGKTDAKPDRSVQTVPIVRHDGMHRLPLEKPSLKRLLAEDPPYALVSESRRSIRRQGSAPLTSAQLSEFLFRTLHERDGRRPYPSGGACYPLKAYIAVHRCLGLEPGLFAYDPIQHELITAGESGTALDLLLADAAGAAAIESAPQVLVVLTAQFARMQRMYPDIGYSLILKEVGALFQAAVMAAAAMGLGACPLGCGNTMLFAELISSDPLIESSVGEIMLGSLPDTA